jgi:PEP-CTERM motif
MKLYVAALAALTTLGAAEARCVPVSSDFEFSLHDGRPWHDEWFWPRAVRDEWPRPQTAWAWDRDSRGWEPAGPSTLSAPSAQLDPSDPPDPPTSTTPIPEPSTWTMLLIGFAGLSYAGLRRRAKRNSPAFAD